MPRRVDTPGQITDKRSSNEDTSRPVENLIIEVPLWKLGRVRFESRSQKASLGLFAFVVILLGMLVLGGMECLPGQHPGVTAILDKLGQALLLILGVLLGVEWDAKRD
jgi:hypothetical protein